MLMIRYRFNPPHKAAFHPRLVIRGGRWRGLHHTGYFTDLPVAKCSVAEPCQCAS